MSRSPRPYSAERLKPGTGWLVPLIACAALAAQSCGSDSKKANDAACPGVTHASCPSTVPSYKTDIAPLVAARCGGCHSDDNDAGLWPLTAQEDLLDWADTILRQIRSCSQPPASSGITLSAKEHETLEAWLVCGAPNN